MAIENGHGIAEEIVDLLKTHKSKLIRITFNEITEKAIKNAIANPSGFDTKMANASEARNILDKLVRIPSAVLFLFLN